MNLYLRLLMLFVKSLFRPRIRVMDESKLNFLVLPNDLDVYGHVNNSRYLAFMDLGRMDLILRSDLGQIISQNGWNPVIGSVSISFRRSLKLFEKFTLRTRIIWWDEKWFYIDQRFESSSQGVCAFAVAKGVFVKHGRRVPVEQVLAKARVPMEKPSFPDTLKDTRGS